MKGHVGCSRLWLSELLERDMGAELLIEIGPSYDGCQMCAGNMGVEEYYDFKSTRLGACSVKLAMSQDIYDTTNGDLFRDDTTASHTH